MLRRCPAYYCNPCSSRFRCSVTNSRIIIINMILHGDARAIDPQPAVVILLTGQSAPVTHSRMLLILPTTLHPQALGDIVIGSVLGPSSQRANECRIASFFAGEHPLHQPCHASPGTCCCFLGISCSHTHFSTQLSWPGMTDSSAALALQAFQRWCPCAL